MDGLTDDSPLAPVLVIWDYTERLLHVPGLQFVIVWAVVHVFLFGVWRDLVVALGFLSYRNHAAIYHLSLLGSFSSRSTLIPLALVLAVTLIKTRLSLMLSARHLHPAASWSGPAKPYFIPCRTTHTRFTPKKHTFSYSYLLVGIPVGCSASINGMLSMDIGSARSCAWYDVDPADHLHRGLGQLGLRGKLDSYLISQVRHAVEHPA